jgi:hypothetical protein
MNISETEWKVVTKQDKKRVMRKRHGQLGRTQRYAGDHSSSSTTSTSNPQDETTLLEALEKCKESLVPTMFFRNLERSLRDAMEKRSGATAEERFCIRQLVCYGVGNFSRTSLSVYSSSFWQLACAMCLRDTILKESNVPMSLVYYDPMSDPFENNFLSDHLNVTVLTVNEQGNRPVQSVPTLFFMPHCPCYLYENVLWSNWDQLKTDAPIIFLVGNSFRNHCEAYHSNDPIDCPCMKAMLLWTHEAQLDDEKNDSMIKKSVGYERAFNDTFFVTIAGDDTTEWPERPYDTMRTAVEMSYEAVEIGSL